MKVHKAWWTLSVISEVEKEEVSGWEFITSSSVLKMKADESTQDNLHVVRLLFAVEGKQLATLNATQCCNIEFCV